MNKFTLPALVLLIANLTTANAAEITTCIIDTSIKTNPRVYFFPVTSTGLRCDHVKNSASITLAELYNNNWRLLQVINPIEFSQKDKATGYTPVMLYLERTKVPPKSAAKDVTSNSSSVSDETEDESTNDETTQKKSGSIFGGWFKGEKQDNSESE